MLVLNNPCRNRSFVLLLPTLSELFFYVFICMYTGPSLLPLRFNYLNDPVELSEAIMCVRYCLSGNLVAYILFAALKLSLHNSTIFVMSIISAWL